MKKPSKDDPSKPKEDGYAYKKQFYQSDEVAADYDQHRFTTPTRQRRNRREWAAVERALAGAEGTRIVLDMPCGTGRFTGNLARAGYLVVGADISVPMMRQAQSKPDLANPNILGYVQADAEHIPLASQAVDCVMCIRFMFHVDSTTRRSILREMGRVSKRWLVVDYRHCYSPRWLIWRISYALGLTKRKLDRVSRQQLENEFTDAGLKIVGVYPSRRLLSDKWMVLAESPGNLRERVQTAAAGSDMTGLEIGERIGAGRRSEVYEGRFRNREVVVKVYRSAAIERNLRKIGQPIARFEYERNEQLYRAAGVSRYVAEPIGYVVTDDLQFFVQERISGTLYYYHATRHGTPPGVRAHLDRLLGACHAAGIYDLDLHAMNVLLQRDTDGELIPRMFDFNQIPDALSARNPLITAGIRLGLINLRSRDRRRLNRFDDFGRVERKLIGRYFLEEAPRPGSSP